MLWGYPISRQGRTTPSLSRDISIPCTICSQFVIYSYEICMSVADKNERWIYNEDFQLELSSGLCLDVDDSAEPHKLALNMCETDSEFQVRH